MRGGKSPQLTQGMDYVSARDVAARRGVGAFLQCVLSEAVRASNIQTLCVWGSMDLPR